MCFTYWSLLACFPSLACLTHRYATGTPMGTPLNTSLVSVSSVGGRRCRVAPTVLIRRCRCIFYQLFHLLLVGYHFFFFLLLPGFSALEFARITVVQVTRITVAALVRWPWGLFSPSPGRRPRLGLCRAGPGCSSGRPVVFPTPAGELCGALLRQDDHPA